MVREGESEEGWMEGRREERNGGLVSYDQEKKLLSCK